MFQEEATVGHPKATISAAILLRFGCWQKHKNKIVFVQTSHRAIAFYFKNQHSKKKKLRAKESAGERHKTQNIAMVR